MAPSNNKNKLSQAPSSKTPRFYQREAASRPAEGAQPDEGPVRQRDEWMLVPPSDQDWARNLNPTRMKSRSFNTGKSARRTDADREPAESEDQRAAAISRLHDQQQLEQARKAAERGPSLVELHSRKRDSTSLREDDPATRPFDREKDVWGGERVDVKRLQGAKDSGLGSMFSKGSYL